MNAVTRIAAVRRPARPSAAEERKMLRDAERWSFVRVTARLIPRDINLDNECEVVFALLEHRYSAKEIDDVRVDAVAVARELRGGPRARL